MSAEHVIPVPLQGVEIRVDKHLVGSKCALQFGDGPVYASPAMYDLIKHASPDELRTLAQTIRIKKLPALPTLSQYANIPMFTQPPKWE